MGTVSTRQGTTRSVRARCRHYRRRKTRAAALAGLAFSIVGGGVAVADVAGGGFGATGTDGGSTVSVGVSGSSSTPGSADAGGSTGAGSGSGPACTWTLLSTEAVPGLANGGDGGAGSWYLVTCPNGSNPGIDGSGVVWVPASLPAAAPASSIDPATVAEKAESSMTLPSPVIHLDPPSFSVVHVPTWLWIDPAIWHQYQATAQAAGVAATATAVPRSVTWEMGDGGAGVVCPGPGVPYRTDVSSSLQSTDCSYVYERSSAGQPSVDGNPNDGSFEVTAIVTWSVSWSAPALGAGGTLAPLQTSSSTQVRVEEIQAVDTIS